MHHTCNTNYRALASVQHSMGRCDSLCPSTDKSSENTDIDGAVLVAVFFNLIA